MGRGGTKNLYALERFFNGPVPNDVKSYIQINGIRQLKSGSKFKVCNQRGEYIFLYSRGNSITCFDPLGRFAIIDKTRVKRALNRSRREIHKGA